MPPITRLRCRSTLNPDQTLLVPPAGGGVRDVFQLEELPLSGQEALMVVVMEFCDLGGCRQGGARSAACFFSWCPCAFKVV